MEIEKDDLPTPQSFALIAGIFEGGLALLAVGLGWLLGQRPLETFRWSLADAGWGVAATVPPLVMFGLCLKCPWRPFVELVRVVDSFVVPLFRHVRVVELAAISLLAGLGEEMLFRGVIQQAVTDWVGEPYGHAVGLAVAAFLFGLVHRITLTYAILAGLIGLYLGAIWLLSGNLLVPILAHALYDFVAMVYLVRLRRQEPDDSDA
jgi:membrane protease YdiL (CAAX protease family)